MSNKLLFKNTLVMYVTLILTILVGFYTSRAVLNTLGVDDFGIYSLIGGFILFFAFLNGAMSTAVQRYLSAALGKNDPKETTELFNTAIVVHIGLAAIIVILSKTIGEWFLMNKLSIPPERLDAAYWVYQAVIITFVFQIIATPAQAILLSYEKMISVSVLNFLAPFGRLMAILIAGALSFDKLIAYAVIISIVAFLQFTLYFMYATVSCPTARYMIVKDKNKYQKLTSYAGWDLIGNLVGVIKEQGTPVIMNMFFGVTVNAATGVVNQLSTNLLNFSMRATQAAAPQIVKSYNGGNKERAFQLVEFLSKLGFGVLFIFAVPLLFETEYLLTLWLKTPPPYAVLFVRLALIVNLIDVVSQPLMNLAHATGNIKMYHLYTSVIMFFFVPLLYILYKLGLPAQYSYILAAIFAVVKQILRLAFIHRETGMEIRWFVNAIILRQITLATIASLITLLMVNLLPSLTVLAFSPLLTMGVAYQFLLNKEQKENLLQRVLPKLSGTKL